MAKSAYLRDALLTWLKEDGFAPELLNGLSVSLHTADPGEDGANEHTAGVGNYARANSGGFVDGGDPGTLMNDNEIGFLTADEDYEAPITHFGLWDQGGGGNFLGGNQVDTPRTIIAGMTPRFAINSLIWSEF